MLTRVWPRTRRLNALDATVTRMNPTDADLVQACLDGDRHAFDTIVERHQRAVYRVCYRFSGTHEDASDLAQDVFVRAYKGLRTFKGHASLTTWLSVGKAAVDHLATTTYSRPFLIAASSAPSSI